MDLNELWDLVLSVPSGRCTTYGALGRALSNPTSGRMVGRWMAQCPSDIPWWRVINKQGGFPLFKSDPFQAAEQKRRLVSEGIPFKQDSADLAACFWEPGE